MGGLVRLASAEAQKMVTEENVLEVLGKSHGTESASQVTSLWVHDFMKNLRHFYPCSS